jgi:hypothetical protein
MSKELKKLLAECKAKTERDFEGSDSFRLHYKAAQDLISSAYNAGKAEVRAEILAIKCSLGNKHDWEVTSMGDYDDSYRCKKCGKENTEEADAMASTRNPVYGCVY